MVDINVCIGSACHLKGSYGVINKLQSLIEEQKLGEKVTVKAAFCLGNCTGAVCVKVNEGEVMSVTEKNINEFFTKQILTII